MKTAISIPDDTYADAESWAAKLHMTRSQLYTTAIQRHLQSLRAGGLTDAMNRYIDQYGQDSDPVTRAQAAKTLRAVEW